MFKNQHVKRIITELKFLRVWLLAAFVLHILLYADGILQAHFMGVTAEAAIATDHDALVRGIVSLMVVIVFNFALSIGTSYTNNVFLQRGIARVRRSLLHALTVMPLEQLERRHSGDLLSRLDNDSNSLSRFLG